MMGFKNYRCDRRYETGTVTGMLSDHAAEVNGIPRHVRDLRSRASDNVANSTTGSDGEDDEILIRFPVGADDWEERDSDVNEEEDTNVGVADAVMLRRSDKIRKQKGMYIVQIIRRWMCAFAALCGWECVHAMCMCMCMLVVYFEICIM